MIQINYNVDFECEAEGRQEDKTIWPDDPRIEMTPAEVWAKVDKMGLTWATKITVTVCRTVYEDIPRP